MRRVNAGEESASASAAAFREPSRATCTKASMAVSGGSLRIAFSRLQLCAAQLRETGLIVPSPPDVSAVDAPVAHFFALAQILAEGEKTLPFRHPLLHFQGPSPRTGPFFRLAARWRLGGWTR